MLYNPKWQKPKADVFTLPSLIAWLKKQPRFKRYDYADCKNCLLAQYFKASGVDLMMVGNTDFAYRDERGLCQIEQLPAHFDRVSLCVSVPFFGWALLKARIFSMLDRRFAKGVR